jgi:hypothetical protein
LRAIASLRHRDLTGSRGAHVACAVVLMYQTNGNTSNLMSADVSESGERAGEKRHILLQKFGRRRKEANDDLVFPVVSRAAPLNKEMTLDHSKRT